MATSDEDRLAERVIGLVSGVIPDDFDDSEHREWWMESSAERFARAYLDQRAELDRLRAEVAATREAEAGAKFAGTSLVDWLRSEADRQDRITDELLTGELPDGQRNCRVPFQQFFAMAYRKIAELIENTAAPDLLAEVRRLRAANAELVQLMKESLMFTQHGVYTVNASLVGGLYPQINLELLGRINAALDRHDAGKGGGE